MRVEWYLNDGHIGQVQNLNAGGEAAVKGQTTSEQTSTLTKQNTQKTQIKLQCREQT
jgi:hypothetical protein